MSTAAFSPLHQLLHTYHRAGWHPLPLPPRAKTPPPGGYTGVYGVDAGPEELDAWAARYPADANIALRLPDGVVGIDVDSYGNKPGAATLAGLVAQLGPLPPTWLSTSRGGPDGPGTSAIALYRVPEGLVARSLGGEGIEIVQHRHRYAVVSPSVHPDGRVYRWYAPDGRRGADGAVPLVEDLAELPESWVAWLRTLPADTPQAGSRADAEALLGHLEAAAALDPCLEIISFCHTALARMQAAGEGGRHDTMTGLVYRLVATCATGHHGWGNGREFLRQLWEVCVGDPSRSDEFERMYSTAAAKVCTDWTDGPQLTDPCTALFGGSMAAVTEPLDLAKAGTDRDLARLVLDHQRGRVRFLSDIDRWATLGADDEWDFGLSLSPAAGAVTILDRSLDWALSGSSGAEAGTDDARRWKNRMRLSSAAGQGAAASLMVARARSDTYPNRIEYASLDTDTGIFWAGGQPWDLAASTDRLVRADLDPRTPHLRTAGYLPKHGPTPLWDAFLAAILPDPAHRDWVQLLLGGTLTGRGARILLIFQGEAGRAKTQVLTMVSDLLGTGPRGYAVAADRRILSDDPAHASTLMALAGRRLAWIDEGPRRGRASIERLKALTGGGLMTANAMRSDPVTFRPMHTLALTSNDDPEVSDPALLDRVRLVRLEGDPEHVRTARAPFGDLDNSAWRGEAPSILARLIGYAGRWLEDPTAARNPVDVQAHLADLATEQDTITQWMLERTAPDGWTAASSLYEDYRQFARAQGIPDHRVETATLYGRVLRKHGVERRRTARGNAWKLVLRRFQGPDLTGVFGPVQTYDKGQNEAMNGSHVGFESNAQPCSPEGGAPSSHVSLLDGSLDGSSPSAATIQAGATSVNTDCVYGLYGLSVVSDLDLKNHSNKGVFIGSGREMGGTPPEPCSVPEAPEQKIAPAETLPEAPRTVALPALKRRGEPPEAVTAAVAASALVALIATPEGRVTLDVEHTGYPIGHPDYALRTVQLGDDRLCVDLDADDPGQLAMAVRALDAAREIHAHSATADVIPLAMAAGVEPGRWWPKVTDTGIMAALNPPADLGNPRSWKLKDLARLLEDPQTSTADKARAKLFTGHKWLTNVEPDTPVARSGWAQVDPGDPVMVDYAASDVLDTHALADMLRPGIPDAPGLLERERTVQRITARIAHRGWRLDPEQVRAQLTEHTEQAAEYASRLAAAGIANPNSNPQLTSALVAAGAQLPTTKAGNHSADKDVLEGIAPEGPGGVRPRTTPAQTLAADLLDYRHHDTLLKLFLRGFDVQARQGDGRVRPTILTLGAAATGRMSATRPNVQQIPRQGGMRECFLADPGELLVSADFSSVEVRVAAWVSGDVELARMIREGLDLHALIAERVWGPDYTKADRYQAKRAVFGWIYGAGMKRVALQLGAHGAKAQQVVDAMHQVCPGLVQWSAQLRRDVERGMRTHWQHGSGRITWLPSDQSHKATNYVIQSTARELLVEALLRLEAAIPGLPVIPVHDEIVTMTPEPLAGIVGATLAECMKFSLPMPDGTFVPIEAEPATPAPRWWSTS